MDRTFTNEYGDFTFNTQTNTKVASLFQRGSHHIKEDLDILERYITNESVVLDVGAHVGTIAVPMARLAHTVYAFEPMEENIKYLRQNIAQNNLSNVVIHETAVGAHVGSVGMVQRSTAHTGGDTVQGEGSTPMISLDSLRLGRVDLIKIDVEGYEPEVFEGATEIIKQHAPVVFFEINLPELRRHGRAPLKRIEHGLRGYSFYYNGRHFSTFMETLLKARAKILFV